MGLIVLALAGVILWWAWRKGHVRSLRYPDLAAAAIALIGVVLLMRGQELPALAALGGAGWWYWSRRKPAPAAAMTPQEARRLLDLRPGASADEIRAAHRRLVARVHPDVGGSADLAQRVNLARDVLLRK